MRRPLFAVLATSTFALGIGVTTAIFGVVHGVLLRDLPYESPDRVIRLQGTRRGETNRQGTLAYLNYRDIAERATTLSVSAAYDEWRPNLTGGGEPVLIDAAQVNPGFFDVFGVRPAAGRFFLPEEDIDGRDRVVVLSWSLWQSRWDGDPTIIGREIQLNGNAHTVVGVAPQDFEDPLLSGGAWGQPALWRPLGYVGVPADQQPSRGSSSYVAVARLSEGATLEQARAEMASLSAALEAEYPATNEDVGMTAIPIRDSIVGDVRGSLLVLLGAVGFVLAIAAANVGSLLLGRAAERRSEIAVRAALGASRTRIVRQSVVEALVIAFAGGSIGVVIAVAATRSMSGLVQQFVPRTDSIDLSLPVLLFALVITLFAGLVCATLPAVLASGTDPRATLAENARGSTGGNRSRRYRRGLVITEVALAVVLLVGAGLLGRTLWNLMTVDVGFDAAGLLTFDLAPPSSNYADADAVAGFYDELLDRLRAMPGVRSAALVNIAPLTGGFDCNTATLPGEPESDVCPEVRTVTPGYFATAGQRLTAGRAFGAEARAGSPPVAIITEALGRALWPGEDPIGRRFEVVDTLVEVIGVTADVKHLALAESARPMVFVAADQRIVPWHGRRMTVFLRTSGDPLMLASGVRTAVRGMDAQLPLTNLRTMESVVSSAAAAPRFRALLLGSFAALALVLATIGIYGVVSFSVAQRTREMAIRMALGAHASGVVRLVLRDGLAPVIVGTVLGLLFALALSRILAALLFGVTATDTIVFVGVPAALLAAAAAATLLPARRATRTHPMSVLRES